MMKQIYLMHKTYSKHFSREIFLMLQMLITIIILNAAILPFTQYARLESHLAPGLSKDTCVYYSVPLFTSAGRPMESFDYTKNTPSVEYISRFYEDDKIDAVCIMYRTYGTVNGQKAEIFLYNSGMFENAGLKLKSGTWKYDTDKIYVNTYIDSKISKQDSVQVVLNDSCLTDERAYKVGGVINKYDIVYKFVTAGYEPEFNSIGFDYSLDRQKNPSKTKLLAIIPYNLENIENIGAFVQGALLKLKDGVSPQKFAEEYNSADNSGRIVLLDELPKNSVKRLVLAYRMNVMLAILLVISTIFGIGGYSYLKIAAMQKQAAVYYLCGCGKMKYARTVIFSGIPIVVLPVTAAFFLKDVIVMSEGCDNYGSLIISAVFVCAAFLIPMILTLMNIKKLSFSELLYNGD